MAPSLCRARFIIGLYSVTLPLSPPPDSASERKKKVFAERRKAHYNEFQVLKKIGKDLHFEEEEDAQLAVALAESAAAAAAHHQANKRTPAAATPTSVPCPSPGRVDEHMSDP